MVRFDCLFVRDMDGGVELAMVEAEETREGVEGARFKGISISGFVWRTQTNDEHLNTSSSNQTSQPPLQSYPATCPPFLQSSPHQVW